MKKFKALLKKEFTFLVRDRKSLITSIIMTVFLVPLIFGVLGFIQKVQDDANNKEEIVIGFKNENSNLELINTLKKAEFEIKFEEDLNNALKSGDISGYFESKIENEKEEYTYIYDQSSNDSSGTIERVSLVVNEYSQTLTNQILSKYNLNLESINPVTFSTDTLQNRTGEKSQDSFALFFLPYIIIIGLIQGAMAYAIELTAGEKERNTLATTMSLNANGLTIGLAKICVTLLFSLLFLILNLLSIVIAFSLFPQEGEGGAAFNFTFGLIAQLGLVMLPLSFFTSSAMIMIGIFARNQKEAQIYSTPIMILSVIIAFSGALFDVNTPIYTFFIPVVGHIAAIKQILLGSFILPNILILTLVTVLGFFAIVAITVKMFRSESVLFRQ